MRRVTVLTVIIMMMMIAVVSFAAPAAEEEDDERIAEALLALPEPLRDGAAVVEFVRGKPRFLREGTNGMTCRADDPDVRGIAVWCYPKSHDAYARRWYQLAAEGKKASEVDAVIVAEIKAGTLEWPDHAVNYNLRGPGLDNASLNTVVFIPFATGDALGISEERSYSRPWLMSAGTAFAHVMIPGQ